MTFAALALAQNTAGAPAWIELIPAGEVVAGADGRSWRNPDPAAVIAASRVSANRPLPLDWEHATETRAPQGLSAPAAGWIDDLELRSGAIWGRVAWTDDGRAHVAGRAYRFVSPVFAHTCTDNRILALKSVGLTNTSNLTLTALNSRERETDMDELTELWSILGLDEGAAPGDVVERVRALATATAANRGEPDPARFVPMAVFEETVRALNAQNTGLLEDQAVERVEAAQRKGQLPPFLKDFAVAMCKRDPRMFDSFIEKTKGASYRMDDPHRPILPKRYPEGHRSASDIEHQKSPFVSASRPKTWPASRSDP